jgi:pimeloyl-ACP methyl ester carboxylesterase
MHGAEMTSGATGLTFPFLLIAAMAAPTMATPPPAPYPIREAAFVRIGGIEQWIAITGDDPRNPVVLFLHGGPGDAYSPFAGSIFRGWEKDFTLVQWDQRGAGRTYGKSGPSVEPAMTVERMVKDGIEVAEYLTRHLHRKRIIVAGGSWGSMLGIEMVHARPELFSAYVGDAQLVNWQKNVAASYARVLELARAANDQPSLDVLRDIGAPPWKSIRTWPRFRKVLLPYQAKHATAAKPDMTIDPAYASPEERAQYGEADDFSFLHFVGMTLSGPLTQVDLPSFGTEFKVPIYMVQGEEDLVAVPALAKAYFDSISAPHKEYHLVPGTGHESSAASLEVLHRVLLGLR